MNEKNNSNAGIKGHYLANKLITMKMQFIIIENKN